ICLGSSLEELTQPAEAPGDAARDRSGREIEGLADGAVALVAGEEAVEDLPAVPGCGGEGLVDGERVLEHGQGFLRPDEIELPVRGRALARTGAQAVDAQPSRELGEPRSDRGVVAQLV